MTSVLARTAPALLLAALAGCGPNYSPNTYSANAVQQANKVEQGVVVGVRPVDISAAGTVGAVSGAAAGGIAGSQATGGVGAALTALGGGVVGGILGSEIEHKVADTNGFEYIVRKGNGELVSVAQKDETALAIGTHVLVIAGPQARIVPDYTVPIEPAKPITATVEPPPAAPPKPPAAAPPAPTPPPSEPPAVVATPAAPATGDAPVSVTPLPAPATGEASPATDGATARAEVPLELTPLEIKPPAGKPLEIKPIEPPADVAPPGDAAPPSLEPAPAEDDASK